MSASTLPVNLPMPLPLHNLTRIAAERASEYRTAKPFPHIVIDNFFDPSVLDAVLEEFPSKDAIKWTTFDNQNEIKLAAQRDDYFGAATKWLMYHLNSAHFLTFLEDLTGIQNLLPDPHFEGGGLHQILRGGKLGIHADFNKHRKLGLDRRLNFLVYLNKNWKEEYGGNLELWDTTMTRCERKVLPVFNRAVIFSTTSDSYHGHPDPLACPEGMTRKSLALYYYTNGRPEEEIGREHSTLFRMRPNEKAVRNARQIIKLFIPPIVWEVRDKVKKRI